MPNSHPSVTINEVDGEATPATARFDSTTGNPIHWSAFYEPGNALFNAAPFSVNGQSIQNPRTWQHRMGFNVGGYVESPWMPKLPKTSFLFNYMATLQNIGTRMTSTVPTPRYRSGDFSTIGSKIFDPTTGQPFPGNQIPSARIDPISKSLMTLIPEPSYPENLQNYELLRSTPSRLQSVNVAVTSAVRPKHSVGLLLSLQTASAASLHAYGFADSHSNKATSLGSYWQYSSHSGLSSALRLDLSRRRSLTLPEFANDRNIAAEMGILGTSPNPLNYGPPSLIFTNFSPLLAGAYLRSASESFNLTETATFTKGNHNWSLGGVYGGRLSEMATEPNARGRMTFGGLITSEVDREGSPSFGTGFDFADFLLGAPQSASIAYGTSPWSSTSHAYSVFLQDDYRARANLTLNWGVRYEFFAPWVEETNQISNLVVARDFNGVQAVTPAAADVPRGLLWPDRNNWAPRVGLAWAPFTGFGTVVRFGYSWHYNPGSYDQFIARLAQQPPFAESLSVNTSTSDVLSLATGFVGGASAGKTQHTFAIDPNYRSMYAQTWNASLDFNVSNSWLVYVAYTGTKGTRLDTEVMPNQASPGSAITAENRRRIGDAGPFIYHSSGASSILHSGQARVARPFRHNVSGSLTYVYSKLIDNSSGLGGIGNVVAQDAWNLRAERGLAAFDRRHSVTAEAAWTVRGFRRRMSGIDVLVRNWTIAGSVALESGFPLTAFVLGNRSDPAGTGINTVARASATGLGVKADSGFFHLGAFAVPHPGELGNAGRNTIPGPGFVSLNVSLQRLFRLSGRIQLQLRIDSVNATNHVNITNLNTVVNSWTYGTIQSAGLMRTITPAARLVFLKCSGLLHSCWRRASSRRTR